MTSRRRFLQVSSVLMGGCLAAPLLACGCARTPTPITRKIDKIPEVEETSGKLSPDETLNRLLEGNRRFVVGGSTGVGRTPEHRREIAHDQHPFAIILGCSDSRIPPELVFDTGLGDLFVIREAGQIPGDIGLGSIEYAARHLHVPFVLVLGHESCGAVRAAVEAIETNAVVEGHMSRIVEQIKPVVEKVKGQKGDLIDNAVRANVLQVVEELKTSTPILAGLVSSGKLRVQGARYDLAQGLVTLV